MKLALKLFGFSMIVMWLSACEQIKNAFDHSAISVDTNAYYSVYQKNSGDNWRVIVSDNVSFIFKAITFTLDDSDAGFGVVFVCPSSRADRPHEVHVYYSTKPEMELINFNCRKSLDEIIEKPIYGSVSGVQMADTANPDGEFARLAISNDVTVDAWEAYAAIVRSGTRDIVGIKGKHAGDGGVLPEKFLIRRKLQLAASAVPFSQNVDFSGVDISFYTKNFSESSRSIVNITGKNQGDIVQSNISFLSRNKTVLDMLSSSQDNFSFLPIPLDEFTETIDDFVRTSEFNPGEGHELHVSAQSTDGSVTREVSKFFTVSEGVVHDMNLPAPIADTPLLALKEIDDMQGISLNWNKYQDVASGNTHMYRWEVEGESAAHLPDKVPTEEIGRVKWHITVTPGWLSAVGATGTNYTLVVPTHYEDGESDGVIDKDDAWRKEWGFRATTPVNWQMSAVSVTYTDEDDDDIEDNNAGDVIDYLLNRNIDEDLQFSQVYVSSTTEPLK